jgi:hypothetical protein
MEQDLLLPAVPIEVEAVQKYSKDPQQVEDGDDFEGGDKSSQNSKAMFLDDYQSQGMKVNYIDLAAMSMSENNYSNTYSTLQKTSDKATTLYQGGVNEEDEELTRIDKLDAKNTIKFKANEDD